MMETLSVIGLGKLGACTASTFASKGYPVVGVDLNQTFVDSINAGKAPVYEPGLQGLINTAKDRLRATTDFVDAMQHSEITFLIVPTPSMESGFFSVEYLKKALRSLGQAYKSLRKTYHLFVITSTVSPGDTEKDLVPLIEDATGTKINQGFGVCYNPEFIALGSVVKNFLNPDMVLIGESNSKDGARLAAIYETTCDNTPTIARMSLVSAEITKISLNSFVTTKISYVNTLANICEAIPNANIDDITHALGADRRISPYYLKGGLGYGGPCFPRDNRAFAAFAASFGVDALIAKATDEVNRSQSSRLVDKVFAAVEGSKNDRVAVLGLAYKPNTPVIEESPAVMILKGLVEKGLKPVVYDPPAVENTRDMFGSQLTYAQSMKECFEQASLVIVTTATEAFSKINAADIVHDNTTIIDCWRLLNAEVLGPKVKLIQLGANGVSAIGRH